MDLWNRDAARGLKLYTQRVYIMDEAEQFLPLYLRFVKGILDSNDLSLNVSREILQQDKNVDSIRTALTKRVLDVLTKMAKKDEEKYAKFWSQFGEVLKEGPAEDFANKEKIASLFRFASTQSGSQDATVSLADYISRMKEDQKKIYYVTGENYNAVFNSPHLEFFKKNNIEVLLLTQRVDEWMISHLANFDEKSFQDITKGELDLDELTGEEEKAAAETLAENNKSLVERIAAALEGEVSKVRVTARLTDSPACLVVGQNDMNDSLRQMLAAAGQPVPEAESTLEVNPNHPLIAKMDTEQDEERFNDLAHVIHGQAQLAQGSQLDKPAEYVTKLNKLLQDLMK
jgi:molecular chaperone HtpG